MISLAVLTAHAADESAPGVRWRTVSTEHFRIHYGTGRDVDGAPMAQRLAAVADTIWLDVCGQLGWFLVEPVHVVVLDHTDEVEGFAIPSWDWIVVSSAPDPYFRFTRGLVSWPEDVLAHELGHVVSNKRARFLSETADLGLDLTIHTDRSADLGANLVLAESVPAAWNEGGAELWAEGAGTGTWNAVRDAHLSTSALEGRWLTAPDTYADKDAWGDSERIYNEGYAFGRYLRDRFGRDVYADLATLAATRPFPSYRRLLGVATGVSADELVRQFREHVTSGARQRADAVNEAGTVEGLEMEHELPAWTRAPDAEERLRFESLRPEGQRRERERTGVWDVAPTMSPDGRWYAENAGGWFHVERVDESWWPALGGSGDLAWGDVATASWPMAFGHGFDFVAGRDEAVVVADAHLKRWFLPRFGRSFTQLYRVDLTPRTRRTSETATAVLGAGGSDEVLSDRWRRRYRPIPGSARGQAPAVSPDGSTVAYLRQRGGVFSLWLSGLDGGGAHPLVTLDEAWMHGVSWSPDGTRLVLAMQRHAQSELWLVDAHTGALLPLTWNRWQETEPSWGPDGIVFVADVDGVPDVFRIDPSGQSVERLTRTVGAAATPSVTPAGNLLYSQLTAWGWKSVGLRGEHWARTDASASFPRPPADASSFLEERDRSFESRPYRVDRGLLPVSAAPLFHAYLGEDPAFRGGAYVQVRDAVRSYQGSATALLGEDLYVRADTTVRLFWPEVTIWASHHVEPSGDGVPSSDDARLTRAGAVLALPWTDEMRIGLRGSGWWTTDRRGARLGPFLGVGDAHALAEALPAGEAGGSLEVIRAWRADGEPYWRAHGDLDAWLPVRIGDVKHALRIQVAGMLADADLGPIEQAGLGGGHATEWYPDRLEPTLALPGYGPYAVTGSSVGVGRGSWRFPVIPRIRRQLGPYYVSGLTMGIGGGVGGVGVGTDTAAAYPEAETELRLAGELLGADWNLSVGFGWGFAEPGGPRPTLAIGSGW